MLSASRVIVFDNLPAASPLRLAGNRADALLSLGWNLTRARTMRGQNKHLGYAPDFLKLCERQFDLAIFYIAKPAQGYESPLAIWNALGFFLARRRKDAAGKYRVGERDVLILCECGEGSLETALPSNLVGYKRVLPSNCSTNSKTKREYIRDVSELITSSVSDYIHSVGDADTINKRNRDRVSKLCESLLAATPNDKSVPQLALSGYQQAPRACDMKQPSFVFATRSCELFKQAEDIAAAIKHCHDLSDIVRRELATDSETNDEFIEDVNLFSKIGLKEALISLKPKHDISSILSLGGCKTSILASAADALELYLLRKPLTEAQSDALVCALEYLATGLSAMATVVARKGEEFGKTMRSGIDLHTAFLTAVDHFETN